MAEKIIFQLQDLHKFYGQVEVLKGITLSFLEGAKIGLIGRNGAGKSTLLRIIAGEDREIEGTARAVGNISIGYLAQEPPLDDSLDVWGNLMQAVQPLKELEERYNEVCADMEGREEEFERLSTEMEHHDVWNLESRLEQAAGALGLPPPESDVKTLSGGERRRVALCRLLLQQPDILLLDEPTNHLDADSVEWLEHHLAAYPGTVILITHDRYFLDNVVGWMLEIERGKARPYEGNYSQYLEQKQRDLDTRRQSRLEKTYQRELEWVRKTPAARAKRSKARLERFKELQEARPGAQLETTELRIPPGPRLGDKVLEVRELRKGYGGRTLIDGLSFELPPGGILGVIGANGMGKTTLMRMIMGREKPDSGSLTVGSTVVMRYLDQSRTILDDEKTVFENITEGNEQIEFDGRTLDARAFVARFNFKGEEQQKLLGECSGGMRNRVLLAKMLREPANLIILDEPTNDLDLDTLRVLEEAIQNFPGCMVVVSHDRYFLDRICSRIIDLGHYEPGKYLDSL
jgi:sulfate-transporting ATPase